MRDAFFWLAVLSCVLGQALIFRSTFRVRARAARSEGTPAPRFASELAWTLLPAAMLAVTLVFTWRALP